MSSQDEPKNQNLTPDPERPDLSDVAGGSTTTPDSSKHVPLPVFDDPDDDSLVKTVSDRLPQLEAVLKNQELPPPQPPAQPLYQISSAEKDWDQYPMPSLEEDSPEDEESGWQTTWGVVREIGETIILTLIIFFLIQTVIRNFRVVGTSMNDNLQDGQYLIIDKLTYSDWFQALEWGGPAHGDVIVFEPPTRPNEDYVKRIVALPGETVEVKDGKVWVNGQMLDESFQPKRPGYTVSPLVVPQEHVYVLGDNRNNSNDSHNWGPLPVENIVGRAWLSYWPPDLWGSIPNDAPTHETTLKNLLEKIVPNANAENE